MLICSHGNAIVWFARGEGTQRLWPQPPSRHTYAYDILHNASEENPGDVQADAWFDHPIADRYTLHEHSLRGYSGHVLSLLRLLETFPVEEVTYAVRQALQLGAISFDAVKHLTLCRIEQRPPRLDLDCYPHLPLAQVATTAATDYLSLLRGAAV